MKKEEFTVAVGTAAIGILIAAIVFSSWPLSQAQDQIVSLRGAGSTFAAPLYKKWIEEYAVSHRGVTISYDPIGMEKVSSGSWIARLISPGATKCCRVANWRRYPGR